MAAAVIDHQSNRLAAADAGYDAILAAHPDHADALHYRGVIRFQRGDFAAARDAIQRAIELRPNIAAYHVNLGNALTHLGDPPAALAAYQAAIQLEPGLAGVHFNRALLLAELGRTGEAVAALRAAVRQQPQWPEAWLELGRMLYAEEALDAALEAYRTALRLNPQLAAAHLGLAPLLLHCGDVAGAIRSYEAAEQLDPANPDACAGRLFALGLDCTRSGAELLAEHRLWQTRFADRITPLPVLSQPRGERLRIAYLSGDFRRHAMRFFVQPILQHHDRRQVTVAAYATHAPAQSDAATAALRRHADEWVECHGLDDAALARRIADDRIDVLVDLAGHTQGGRLLALAAHPARVQCAMLGYMTTTGAACIDARIADAVAIPPAAEAWFTEKILRLPHSQWCYAPDADAPPVTRLPALSNGYVTYGAFHNAAKINAQVLALWARMLLDQPTARLVMIGWGEAAQRWLRQPFEQAGVGARVTLLDPLPHARYLALYQQIDISLDTFPYSGGTVTCESLWMGVPVLTLAHDSPHGRGGASILSALDLPAWIVAAEDAWVARAAELAADLTALAELRQGLRQRMQSSPLMDAPGYVAALENLFAAC